MVSNIKVERFRRVVRDVSPGYITVEHEESYQQLVKYEINLLGRPRRLIIDEEIIPDHVMISLGAFGDTGGWKSKFAIFIGQ